jgi:methyltransferase
VSYAVVFALLLGFIVLQRLFELRLAKRNERLMRAQGAVEHGAEHYKYIVALHVGWILGMLVEAYFSPRAFPAFAPLTLGLWLLLQLGRYWVMRSLGPYWNTRVLVVPGAKLIATGPFRFLKHPNYLIVALELALVPLTFGLYLTALLATVANALVMSVRIPVENRALASLERQESGR